MTREQLVRAARARAAMAGVWAAGALLAAALMIALADGSPTGTVFGVIGAALVVGVVAAVCLVPVNLSLARNPERGDAGGAADLLTLGAGVGAVVAVVLTAVLGRPYELVMIPVLALALVLHSLLVLIGVATRHAARRPYAAAAGQSERGSSEE